MTPKSPLRKCWIFAAGARSKENAASAQIAVSQCSEETSHWGEPQRVTDGQEYGRLVRGWVISIGLEPSGYGTHPMRRTKVAEIYRKTGNMRVVQLLLGHTKVDSAVLYLGFELEDALSISERPWFCMRAMAALKPR